MSRSGTSTPTSAQQPPGGPPRLEGLLPAHDERVLRYVECHLPREFQAFCGPEDIPQETFTEAVRRADYFQGRGPDSLHQWLSSADDVDDDAAGFGGIGVGGGHGAPPIRRPQYLLRNWDSSGRSARHRQVR